MDKKSRLIYKLPKETHFTSKDTQRLKVRRWEKVFPANGKEKKAGVANLHEKKQTLKQRL